MTEQEYIDATDLAKVRMIRAILRDIVAENSAVIHPDAYREVSRIVAKWEQDLFNVMKPESPIEAD